MKYRLLHIIAIGMLAWNTNASAGDLAAGRYVITAAHSGKCVEVAGAGQHDGANIQQYSCNNSAAQEFDVSEPAAGEYKLLAVVSKKAVDVAASSLADKGNIWQWADNGAAAQRFAIRRVTGSTTDFNVINKNSGKCMDVFAGSLADAANIQQYGCNGNAQQRFRFSVRALLPVLHLPLEVLGDGSPATPVVRQVSLNVAAGQLAGVAQLTFICHRCGFFGAPEFEATTIAPATIKASVRVTGGLPDAQTASIGWTPITDATVQPADPERIQGGISRGGLYTSRITVRFDAATIARLVASPRSNVVQFRFNGTEGESNGFRILNVQLQNRDGVALSANPVQLADIGLQKAAGKVLTADTRAGEILWHGQGRLLKSSIVRRPIRAACASCHVASGRDLQYFNYSDNAIVQRSRFHGLTELQGRQIAAYLRYSQQHVPHVSRAAPWNPPYQPGPGADARPVLEWAAGAGLGAVLDTPMQAIKALFGKPVDNQPLVLSQQEVDAVMHTGGTFNTRQTAIPLQLPDWNAWLPSMHPIDIWPAESNGAFERGASFSAGGQANPYALAAKIDAWLTANRNPNGIYGDWTHLGPAQRELAQTYFRTIGWEAYRYLGGGRGDHIAPSGEYGAQAGAARMATLVSTTAVGRDPVAVSRNALIERAVSSVLQWNAVRQWGWAHEYGLEGDQRQFLGTYDRAVNTWKGRGEARGWPFNTVSVFFLAPHMLYQQDRNASSAITREWVMAWERDNKIGSYYRSNAWYHLQMVVNPGAHDIFSNYPMDWNYQVNFNHTLVRAIGGATPQAVQLRLAHHVRNIESHIKLAQYVNNGFALNAPDPSAPGDIWRNKGMLSRATALKYVAPSHDYLLDFGQNAVDRSTYRDLDLLAAGLYGKILNGTLLQVNSLYAGTTASQWRRCDPANVTFGIREVYASFRFCLDPTRSAMPRDGAGYRMNGGGLNTTDQMLQYSVWEATQAQAEPVRLKTFSDWVDRMWPR